MLIVGCKGCVESLFELGNFVFACEIPDDRFGDVGWLDILVMIFNQAIDFIGVGHAITYLGMNLFLVLALVRCIGFVL